MRRLQVSARVTDRDAAIGVLGFSRTTCKAGLSCGGIFLSFVRSSELVLRSSLVHLN